MIGFPHLEAANIDAVLDQLKNEYRDSEGESIPESVKDLDVRLEEAMRADLLCLFERLLVFAGQSSPHGKPSALKPVTVNCVLGHARYIRAYYAPRPNRVTRQMRRADTRRKNKGRNPLHSDRLERNASCPRKGGSPCAFPLDSVMEVVDGMTPGMQDRMQRSAVLAGSFAEGAALLKKFTGIHISTSTFRRKALAAGDRAVAAQESPPVRVLNPFLPAWLLASTTEITPTLYIMLDGTGVPCVKKDTEGVKGKGADGRAGTREVKVGIVGTYRRLNEKGRPVRDPDCQSHIVSMKTASEFGTLLRRLAFSRGYGTDFRVQVVGDGAEWIANIVEKAFPDNDIIFTNDFYHACEYLHEAVELAENNPDSVRKVYRSARSILLRFGGKSLIKHMRKKRYTSLPDDHEAWSKLKYIEDRCENMKYGEYRKLGLFIASGLVEAACRTDVARRCKQSGMHWRLKNAASMCALTARFRSNLATA